MDKALEVFLRKKIPLVLINAKDPREYEKLIVTSNLLYRFTRPPFVVQPEYTEHVQAIVKEVKRRKLRLTIRCGGHSYAGFSTVTERENCILMDLRKLNKVEINKSATVVTMGGGCQWGEVYKELINGALEGLVINGGRCPYVGVGGFILGAGLGPFTREFGMGSDTLLEATVVTATGDVVVVKKPGNNEGSVEKDKLFWALQGAGQANFGVVTQMKLQIQRLRSKDSKVVSGRFVWYPGPEPDKRAELRKTMNDFYQAKWPDNMTIDSTWLCDLREQTGDGVRFTLYFDGSKAEFDKMIDELITHPVVRKQLKRRSLPELSTRFLYETLDAQWFDESEKFLAENKTYRVYASFAIDREGLDQSVGEITQILLDEMETFRELYLGEEVSLDFVWIHTGGKATEPKPTDTAYYWRGAQYHLYSEVLWKDKWMELNMRGFMAKLKQKLRPFAMEGAASFVNFPDRDLTEGGYERAYYGGNRQELREIKKMWDKNNLFKWKQGIQLPDRAVDNMPGRSKEGASKNLVGGSRAMGIGRKEEGVDASNTKEQTDFFATNLWDPSNWQHTVVRNISEEDRRLQELWS